MSRSRCRRSSISKQRGAEMSSRLMPPKIGRDRLHGAHDLVHVLGGERDRERVHAREGLEDEALALHDGQRRLGPDVAQAQHRRAVGHHRHRVLLDREVVDLLRVVVDGHADARHPRGVGHREVVACLDRHPAVDLDLAAQVHEEGAVGDVHHRDVRHLAQSLDHRQAVRLVGGLEGDVAGHLLLGHLHHVDGPDVAARLADGGGDAAEHAGLVGETDADGQAVAGDGRVTAHDGLLAGLSGRPRIFPSAPVAQGTARRAGSGPGRAARGPSRLSAPILPG